MNQPKVTDLDYINFLIATPAVFSCAEAGRVQPDRPRRAAHDALTRLLHRREPDSTPLWNEAQQHVVLHAGLLIVDDTTLDKPYAQNIELVHRHWSGKHHRVVQGINLVTLLWSDGTDAIPCDYRLYDKPSDGVTKNEHFRAMLATAQQRGFHPRFVAFDSWYSSLANLKTVRGYGWHWLTRLKSNRQVNPDRRGNRALRDCDISPDGTVVHLKGYGLIQVFRIDTPDGATEYWATDRLTLTPLERAEVAAQVWTIEGYHRGLKQFCGVERCQARSARAQRNHVGWAIRAFLRLEHHRICTGTSWFETKMGIIRSALQLYLSHSSPIVMGLAQSPSTA
ncbi:MAG: transposase [Actinomycetota bacterium]|nr:transposase [Actinomycetota bacterium]